MQFPPAPGELLGAIAALLTDQVLAAVPEELVHQVRVAAHLAALLERETRLGPAAAARERELLAALLGVDADDPAAVLAARLRAEDDADFERRAWDALVEVTRQDLAIAKPGHDAWEGR
ncbi:MAG: DUF6285 domain-containing protein [Actinomycetota bacterium]|nr:hypothetical protein [Acidimicrobiia bacterium]MDQ3468465.1 DUF6285 domain-containing protein [Actinomycetota bacterium]